LSLRLATQTAPPPTATRFGPSPTPMTRVTSEPWSIRVTVSSALFVTHTAPAPTATPAGSLPTLMTRFWPLATSTRVTVLLRRPRTQTAPAPTARSCTPSGMTTWATIWRRVGLTRVASPGVPRTPTQTPRSPAATPTILPRSDGIGIGLPITLWLLRPTETRVESRWTPTQSRPESDAAAAGSAPTRGRYGARAPDRRRVASRSLRARSTHTSPPATTTAFGRLPTLIVRTTRPATAGTWSPAGVVVAVVGVLDDAGVPPPPPGRASAATTASATTGIAASAQTQAGRRPARRGPGSARTVGAW